MVEAPTKKHFQKDNKSKNNNKNNIFTNQFLNLPLLKHTK